MLKPKAFRLFHLTLSILAYMMIALLFIILSTNFITDISLIEEILYLLLILSLFYYLAYLDDKIIFNFIHKVNLLLQNNPNKDKTLANIVQEIIKEGILAFPGIFIKRIVYQKMITNENDLLSIKSNIRYAYRWWFLLFFMCLIALRYIWSTTFDLSLDIRFILSLPIIITLFILILYFIDYPYRTLIKLAKKYNITEWK